MRVIIVFLLVVLSGCTSVAEYNTPKPFGDASSDVRKVELWMNDDGENSAVVLAVNGEEAWQTNSYAGNAKSLSLPSGNHILKVRQIYQEFMQLPIVHEFGFNILVSAEFKYIFISQYNKSLERFTYRVVEVSNQTECRYEPSNFKRVVTGKLICAENGSVQKLHNKFVNEDKF